MIEIDLTHERLDFSETSVGLISDTDDRWCGSVRVFLALESGQSVTVYLIPEDAEYIAALLGEETT